MQHASVIVLAVRIVKQTPGRQAYCNSGGNEGVIHQHGGLRYRVYNECEYPSKVVCQMRERHFGLKPVFFLVSSSFPRNAGGDKTNVV